MTHRTLFQILVELMVLRLASDVPCADAPKDNSYTD